MGVSVGGDCHNYINGRVVLQCCQQKHVHGGAQLRAIIWCWWVDLFLPKKVGQPWLLRPHDSYITDS